MFRLMVLGGAALTALAQYSLPPGSMPKDSELVSAASIDQQTDRTAALQLLGRARENYQLRKSGHGYDLRVTFTVNSGGQTAHDGLWEMEDIFDPAQGLHWSANTSGYAITEISLSGTHYLEHTGDYIPLRLHEARAALFDPMPSAAATDNARIRSATVVFNGTELKCVLLSGPRGGGVSAGGRGWTEAEECIDPQSGLLRLQSQAPGRYFSYDYANGPGLEGRRFPRGVTVTEGGQKVTEIRVESLTAVSSADPQLFQPTAAMKAGGPAIVMGEAKKFLRSASAGRVPVRAAVDAVCIFGLVTPSGQLVEAHSLQPGNPDSQAALDDARKLRFPAATAAGAGVPQYFAFIIEQFVSH